MNPPGCSAWLARAFACWNWKCAVLSATARSLVYLAALARTGAKGSFSIVLVEMAYVTLTAGIYAGLQQRALGFSSRTLGNLTIVPGVPVLAQILDWVAHRAAGAAAPGKANLAICIFAAVSGLFHLYVMRRGAFLTGHRGRTFLDDFRRLPRLVLAFVVAPVSLALPPGARLARSAESEAAL